MRKKQTTPETSDEPRIVLSEHRAEVKAFNERMASLQRQGLTWLSGFESFQRGSQISDYRNLYGRSRSGNLKLRTDFSKMTPAELAMQQKIMRKAYEGGTTKTEARQIYEDLFGEPPTNPRERKQYEKEFKQFGQDVLNIKEDSYRRYFYNADTHTTTIAVDMGVTKYEAYADLIQLKNEGHESKARAGIIYEKAIDEFLAKKYIQ